MAKRKTGRLRKGSREAREYMASIRSLRGKGKAARRRAGEGGRRRQRKRGRRVGQPAPPARTNTNSGGGEVATKKRRPRRAAARRTVRRTAVRARRAYRTARNSRAGKAIVPVLVNGALDAGLMVGGRVAGRLAMNVVGARPGSIPAALVSAGAGVVGGLVLDHVFKGDPVRSRMVVAGAMSRAIEDLARGFIPGAEDFLGDPYWELGSAELARFREDDLVRFAGELAPGVDLGAYDYAAGGETIYDPVYP